MKLLTAANIKQLKKFPLYSTDGKPDEERDVLVKFFTPDSNWSWYVLEGQEMDNGDWEFFGLVDGHEKEFGYFWLSQLQEIRGSFGLPVERDRNFEAKLSEVK